MFKSSLKCLFLIMVWMFYISTLQANSNHSMLGVHASAQAIIHFGKIARKHGLTGVCLDSLSRFGNVIYPLKRYLPFGNVIYSFKVLFTQWKCYLVPNKNVIYSLEILFTQSLWKCYQCFGNCFKNWNG